MMNLIKNYVKFFKNNFINIKKIITIHDYQWLYPDDPNILSYNLYKKEFNKKNAENFLELVNLCDNIIFPSYNILKNYNNLIDLKSINKKIIVNNHCDKFSNHIKFIIPKIDKYVNVAFIGNFIEYKGSKVFKYIFNNIKYHETYVIRYHIFGYLSDDEKNNKIIDDNFIYHGIYNEDNLNEILTDNNIHLLTHLSLFEESYCYALTNSINSGLPILYINHGAFTERLIKNDRYFPTSVNDLLKNFQETLKYIFKNQNKNNNIINNNNLQINKWYINNY